MKRDFLSIVRVVLPVVLAFTVLATATVMFRGSSSIPAWAALQEGTTTAYSNVIIVAMSRGDFRSVQKALDSITDNSPTNRYLIWVAPGIYTERVVMKPYVDIKGAGELVTRITATGGQSNDLATVRGANDAELSSLTVENTGNGALAVAIYSNGASPRFHHLTSTASGGFSANYAFFMTVGSPTLRNVTASASGGGTAYGLFSLTASPTVIDSESTASGGSLSSIAMWNFSSSPTVRNSKLSAIGSGTYYAVANASNSGSHTVTIDNSILAGSTNTINSRFCCYVTRVGASKLEGGPVLVMNDNIVTCAGVYDENYTFFPDTCP